MTSDLETNIISVERVKEYIETPTEVSFNGIIFLCLVWILKFTLRGYIDQKSLVKLGWNQLWGICAMLCYASITMHFINESTRLCSKISDFMLMHL